MIIILKYILKNGYPVSLMDKQTTNLTVEKKQLAIVPPFLGELSLQTRAK